MKKLISLFLILCSLLSLFACSKPGNNDGNQSADTGKDNEDNKNNVTAPTVAVPEYKDYGRGSLDFDKLVYSRPNVQSALDAINEVTEAVTSNSSSYTDQIEKIRSLESLISNVKSMYSLARINKSENPSVEFWKTEYAYLSKNYPKVTEAVEKLMMACANSEHRSKFEKEYFEYSLDRYSGLGTYTENAVALMIREAELEAEFSSLSKSTVSIVYDSAVSDIFWEGTVEEVIAMAREYHKNDDKEYEKVLLVIDTLYKYELAEREKDIYIELLKTRRLIADELGLDSYADIVYKSLGYDYTAKDMTDMLSSIGKYASAVASDLEYTVFQSYFQKNPQPTVNEVIVINGLYSLYARLGKDYSDAYSYMLQHGLYGIKKDSDREAGAFTEYVDSNSSPFIYMNASGFAKDYLTLSHEFGHFLDAYINDGKTADISVSEVSAMALELLTVLELKRELNSAKYAYVEYYALYSYLNKDLLTNSFNAAFEHIAYGLGYDEITEANLNEAVESAFRLIFGADYSIEAKIDFVLSEKTILSPFTTESDVVAELIALDIFFKESHRTGSVTEGFKLYEALINRGGKYYTLSEALEIAGIDSPFEEGKVKEIADNIYFHITGKHYYKKGDNDISAA